MEIRISTKNNVTDKFSNNSIKYSPKGKNIAIKWRKRIAKKPKKNQMKSSILCTLTFFWHCWNSWDSDHISIQIYLNCPKLSSASFQGIKIECHKPDNSIKPLGWSLLTDLTLFNRIWILENILLFYIKCSTLTGLCYTLKKLETLPN